MAHLLAVVPFCAGPEAYEWIDHPFDALTSIAFALIGVWMLLRMLTARRLERGDRHRTLQFIYVNYILWGIGALIRHGWGARWRDEAVHVTLSEVPIHTNDSLLIHKLVQEVTCATLFTSNEGLMALEVIPSILSMWSIIDFLLLSNFSGRVPPLLSFGNHILLFVAMLTIAIGHEDFNCHLIGVGVVLVVSTIRVVVHHRTCLCSRKLLFGCLLCVLAEILHLIGGRCNYLSTHGMYHVFIACGLHLLVDHARTTSGSIIAPSVEV
jgi:uncharacterized membrane protein